MSRSLENIEVGLDVATIDDAQSQLDAYLATTVDNLRPPSGTDPEGDDYVDEQIIERHEYMAENMVVPIDEYQRTLQSAKRLGNRALKRES